jgi:hypothetical protein
VPTSTPTSTPGPCPTFEQEIGLTIGALRRLESRAGDGRYSASYDVNGDGVIDGLDVLRIVTGARCERGHDDDDGGRD